MSLAAGRAALMVAGLAGLGAACTAPQERGAPPAVLDDGETGAEAAVMQPDPVSSGTGGSPTEGEATGDAAMTPSPRRSPPTRAEATARSPVLQIRRPGGAPLEEEDTGR